jgi:transcriptional regulator with XRE-family HTH domain
MPGTGAASFAALLKRQRLAAGLTQEALAERAGLSAKAVSDLERDPGRSPRLATVTLLADALGAGPEQRAELLAAARRPTRRARTARPGRLRASGGRAAGPYRGRSPR